MSDKYAPVHIDLYAHTVFSAIEEILNRELVKTHSVTGLLRLSDDKFLVRMEWNPIRAVSADHSSEVQS